MRNALISLAMVGLMASPALAQRGRRPSPFELGRNGWLTDYRQAREAARESGKPIFLVFRCVP
jgi:hypothetical protein